MGAAAHLLLLTRGGRAPTALPSLTLGTALPRSAAVRSSGRRRRPQSITRSGERGVRLPRSWGNRTGAEPELHSKGHTSKKKAGKRPERRCGRRNRLGLGQRRKGGAGVERERHASLWGDQRVPSPSYHEARILLPAASDYYTKKNRGPIPYFPSHSTVAHIPLRLSRAR